MHVIKTLRRLQARLDRQGAGERASVPMKQLRQVSKKEGGAPSRLPGALLLSTALRRVTPRSPSLASSPCMQLFPNRPESMIHTYLTKQGLEATKPFDMVGDPPPLVAACPPVGGPPWRPPASSGGLPACHGGARSLAADPI